MNIGGQNHAFLARLNRVTGTADPEWNAQANGGVSSVASMTRARLVPVGTLPSSADSRAAALRMLSPGTNTTADPDWNPGSNGIVRTLQLGLPAACSSAGANALADTARSGIAAVPRTRPDLVFANSFE